MAKLTPKINLVKFASDFRDYQVGVIKDNNPTDIQYLPSMTKEELIEFRDYIDTYIKNHQIE